jgi:hypothetical protein
VPVWVTENNVNADYDIGNGMSACNPGQIFVTDVRGTSPFFAAWRSLVFASLGEVGAQALYHWSFGVDPQYGEIDSNGEPVPQLLGGLLSLALAAFAARPGYPAINASGCCLWSYNGGNPLGLDTHTLAARNPDGSVVILMSNHAVAAANDNNGPGTVRQFMLDVSALGAFTSATLVQLDAGTPATGPVPVQMTPAAQMQVVLEGYGAALLRLSNASPLLTAAGVANAASYTPGAVAPGEIVSLFGTRSGRPPPRPWRSPIRCWWPTHWRASTCGSMACPRRCSTPHPDR